MTPSRSLLAAGGGVGVLALLALFLSPKRRTSRYRELGPGIAADLNSESGAAWLNLGLWKPGCKTYTMAAHALALEVARVACLKPGDDILDVGCGLGASLKLWAAEFAAARVVGVNASEAEVQCARQLCKSSAVVRVVRCDAANLASLAKPPFDACLSIDAAYHFAPSRVEFIAAAFEALRGAGHFAAADICGSNAAAGPISRVILCIVCWLSGIPMANVLQDARGYSAELERAGFVDVNVEDVTALVFEPFAAWAGDPRRSIRLRIAAVFVRRAAQVAGLRFVVARGRKPVPLVPVSRSALQYHLSTLYIRSHTKRALLPLQSSNPSSAPISLVAIPPTCDGATRTAELARVLRRAYGGDGGVEGRSLGSAGARRTPEEAAMQRDEFAQLFAPHGFDPAANEVDYRVAERLVRAFRLRDDDVFVDLGCAEGRLVVAVAALSRVRRSFGVELGPSRAAVASGAAKNLTGSIAERVSFAQASIDDAPEEALVQGTVFFCAVRGGGRQRPALIAEVVRSIRRAKRSAPGVRPHGCNGRPVRLFTAGFDVPDGVGVELRGCFTLLQATTGGCRINHGDDDNAAQVRGNDKAAQVGGAAADPEHGVALYGERGPRAILEYWIDDCREEESR